MQTHLILNGFITGLKAALLWRRQPNTNGLAVAAAACIKNLYRAAKDGVVHLMQA